MTKLRKTLSHLYHHGSEQKGIFGNSIALANCPELSFCYPQLNWPCSKLQIFESNILFSTLRKEYNIEKDVITFVQFIPIKYLSQF